MELNYSQEQRTISWYRDRLGYITGSKVGVLMKCGRAKDEPFSVTAKTYLYQVAGERALNPDIVNDDQMLQYYLDQTTSQSKAMRFGVEQEENARARYERVTGAEVKSVGLCRHPAIAHLASSPDGITESDGRLGCVEIKCPSVSTYAQYVAEIDGNASLMKVNPDYFYQCQNHMACTGADYCDFVAYCPFVANPIHIVRIERDEAAIALIEERVALAEKAIEENYSQLTRA